MTSSLVFKENFLAFFSFSSLTLFLYCLNGCSVDFNKSERKDGSVIADSDTDSDADSMQDSSHEAGTSCNPTICTGCCDHWGICQPGMNDTACGSGGEPCLDCTQTQGYQCMEGMCSDDACPNDPNNWTQFGCDNCHDNDGDGYRGTDCDLPEDYCDDDPMNWTEDGCQSCVDSDGDGLRGTGCDLSEDCDDSAVGVEVCNTNGCPQDGWSYIPEGDFYRGCNEGELGGTCNNKEQPRHVVTLSSYCVQSTEVSVGMYRACKDAGVCTGSPEVTSTNDLCNWTTSPAGRENHPINCIVWSEAREYCQEWMGGDLPSEAQWEKAARGAYPDTRKYPWGNTPEPYGCNNCNWNYCYSSNPPATWPVGYLSSGAGDSPFGLKDMAGNLWEWTLDEYNESIYSTCAQGCTDPVNMTSYNYKIIRGGGYHHPDQSYLRVTTREQENKNNKSLNLGFRCIRGPVTD